MFLISNKVKVYKENPKLPVGDTLRKREVQTRSVRKNTNHLRVNTFFYDFMTTYDEFAIKASVASIVLAVVIQGDTIVLPTFENYRGFFCHKSFRMNRLSRYSFFEWSEWINSSTILQTSFLDAYDTINLSGKIITVYNDSTFDLLVHKTKQIIRIPEKIIYQHVKSPRDISSCPIFSGTCKYGTELELQFDVLGVWDLLFYNICYLNMNNAANAKMIPFSPSLPNINTIVDIDTKNYNVTQALDIICNKWIFRRSSREILYYWDEKRFDAYLFGCEEFKLSQYSDVVNTLAKATVAYNFVNRVFLFISGAFDFLVPDTYIQKALFFEDNPLEAMKFCLNSQSYSKHTLLWFLPHCYQIFARYVRKYPSMLQQAPYIKQIFRKFCKKRAVLNESYHFYVLRGDIKGANDIF